MKTKITLVIMVIVGLWILNKVRIIIFGSMFGLMLWMVIIGAGVWFLSGGISKIPAIKRFIEKYDK